jgi:hypothetical protein
MPHFPQTLNRTRAPRVRVPGGESVNFNLGGRQVNATLRRLSMTGGLVEFPANIGEIPLAEVIIKTAQGQINALVEVLKPRSQGDFARPFRFVALDDNDHQRLSSILQVMRRQDLGE